MTTRLTTAAGALLFAVVASWHLATSLVIDADYSAFLPAGSSSSQRAFMSELRNGVTSRMFLVELSGGAPAALADTSRALARRLEAAPQFRFVSNGDVALGQRELSLLVRHRFVLSECVESPGHFSTEALRDALAQRLDALAGSAGMLETQYLANDPTNEIRCLLQRLTNPAMPRREQGVWFDGSGSNALLVAETRSSGADLTAQDAASTALRNAFAAASTSPVITMEYSSPGAMALASRAMIASDAQILSLVSLLLVLVILAAVYRSTAMVVVCLVPAAAGLVAGIMVVSLAFGSVHGITLAFGATLLGEAVDYPSYLLTQVNAATPIGVIRKRFGTTLRLAILTTAFGSLALVASGFPGLAQLGLLTIVGVLVAGAITWWVIPHWIPAHWVPAQSWRWTMRVPRDGPPGWLRWSILLGGGIVILVLSWGKPWWNDDLAAMNPLPATFKERDIRIRTAIGAPDARFMVVVSGTTQEDALRGSEALRPTLVQWVANGTIGAFDLISDYLPSESTQTRRREALPAAAVLQENLGAALSGLPFRPDAFAPFLRDIEVARKVPALTPADFAGTALGLKVESLLRRDGDGWHVVVPLSRMKEGAALATLLSADSSSQARVLDLRAESQAMMAAYRQQAVVSSLVGFALIAGLLGAGLRSVRRALRVLVPVILGVGFAVGILVAAGTPLTVFHFVALLLTAGIGVNYSLVMEHGVTGNVSPASTWRTLAVVSSTALCTFGLLGASGTPVLRAIGITVCLGVVLCLVCGGLLIGTRADRRGAAC
ncbi:MAG: hypothetical protein ABIO63_03775 [Casimicrobiaceae bacterium]